MRFDVTQVLDAIERHVTTEVALAQAVVDVGQVAWFDALDGGRPVNLLRVGLMVDALSRHLGEDAIMIYPIAGRDLLTDADLTSKERMVLGRWAGDGLIEVVPQVADRVPEVADITGLPLVTRDGYPGLEGRYPWLRQTDRALRLTPGEGGARIVGGMPGSAQPGGPGSVLLSRVWRCPRRDCPTFGERRQSSQAVPRMRAGVPVCPRHDEPLINGGPRPPTVAMALIVDGTVRHRFVVRTGRPVTVGRSPDDPNGLMVGEFVSGDPAQMISRNHAVLELHDDLLLVTDQSTNGTVIRSPNTSSYGGTDEIQLTAGAPYTLQPWDTIVLRAGVELARSDRGLTRSVGPSSSVMGDAPTISMRPQT